MRGVAITNEMIDWLRENAPGHLWKETSEKFNKKFGEQSNARSLRQVANRRKIYSGNDGEYNKNHIPWNKGKKGWFGKGSEKTRFLKGHVPHNHRPVGSERIAKRDGYIEIKVAEPNKWRPKHVIIWEKYYNEKIDTKKDCIIHLDGDKMNLDISNLEKISKSLSVRMSQLKLWNTDKELTKVGLNIAKISKKIGELRHGKK